MDDKAFIIILVVVYGIMFLFSIALAIFLMICQYKVFKKAGQEGWYAIIPVYNIYILSTKIVGKDMNHFILHLIPFVNIYALIVTYMGLSKSFGKDDGFGIGLLLLGVVFWPWLAFSKTITYIGPGGIPSNPDSSNSLTKDWQNQNEPTNV
jgi:hypothetical protein